MVADRRLSRIVQWPTDTTQTSTTEHSTRESCNQEHDNVKNCFSDDRAKNKQQCLSDHCLPSLHQSLLRANARDHKQTLTGQFVPNVRHGENTYHILAAAQRIVSHGACQWWVYQVRVKRDMPSLRVALEADFKLGRTSVRVPAAHIQRITIVGLTRFLDDAKCGGLVYRGVPLALLVFVTTQDDVTLVTDQGQCNSFWPFSHQRFRDHVSPPRWYLTTVCEQQFADSL